MFACGGTKDEKSPMCCRATCSSGCKSLRQHCEVVKSRVFPFLTSLSLAQKTWGLVCFQFIKSKQLSFSFSFDFSLYLHDSWAGGVVRLCVCVRALLFWQSRSAKQRWPWKLTVSNGSIENGCGQLMDKCYCSLPAAWSMNNFSKGERGRGRGRGRGREFTGTLWIKTNRSHDAGSCVSKT